MISLHVLQTGHTLPELLLNQSLCGAANPKNPTVSHTHVLSVRFIIKSFVKELLTSLLFEDSIDICATFLLSLRLNTSVVSL